MTALAFAASIGGAWIGVHRYVCAKLTSLRISWLTTYLPAGCRRFGRLGCRQTIADGRRSTGGQFCPSAAGDSTAGHDLGFVDQNSISRDAIRCSSFHSAFRRAGALPTYCIPPSTSPLPCLEAAPTQMYVSSTRIACIIYCP